jgi:hypothetical protein
MKDVRQHKYRKTANRFDTLATLNLAQAILERISLVNCC